MPEYPDDNLNHCYKKIYELYIKLRGTGSHSRTQQEKDSKKLILEKITSNYKTKVRKKLSESISQALELQQHDFSLRDIRILLYNIDTVNLDKILLKIVTIIEETFSPVSFLLESLYSTKDDVNETPIVAYLEVAHRRNLIYYTNDFFEKQIYRLNKLSIQIFYKFYHFENFSSENPLVPFLIENEDIEKLTPTGTAYLLYLLIYLNHSKLGTEVLKCFENFTLSESPKILITGCPIDIIIFKQAIKIKYIPEINELNKSKVSNKDIARLLTSSSEIECSKNNIQRNIYLNVLKNCKAIKVNITLPSFLSTNDTAQKRSSNQIIKLLNEKVNTLKTELKDKNKKISEVEISSEQTEMQLSNEILLPYVQREAYLEVKLEEIKLENSRLKDTLQSEKARLREKHNIIVDQYKDLKNRTSNIPAKPLKRSIATNTDSDLLNNFPSPIEVSFKKRKSICFNYNHIALVDLQFKEPELYMQHS